MPLVRIEMKKGKSKEYKKTMLDCVHGGLVEAFGIEEWDRFQRIIEIDKDDFETAIFIVMSEPPLENWGMGGCQKG